MNLQQTDDELEENYDKFEHQRSNKESLSQKSMYKEFFIFKIKLF